jgi:DNA-directed RNA polymerase subunit RPC12/RpoP
MVEVLRRLWGDRASLAADFSGPMLPIFRAFTPTNKRNKPTFAETDGVVLPTGASEQHLYEAYLTFAGMRNLTASRGTDVEQLRALLDGLLQNGVLRRGLILGCSQCGRPAFRSIDEVGQVNQCPRCGAANSLIRERWRKPTEEPYWFYDLHPSAREYLANNGEVPLQLSQHLRTQTRNYVDIAEVELLNTAGSAEAEADLIALSDGELITAEAKRPGTLGTGRELARCAAKRTTFAEVLQADQIVIATAAPEFDNASVQALCKAVRDKPWRAVRPRVRVITGLGTDHTTDQEADPLTGGLTPWPKRA